MKKNTSKRILIIDDDQNYCESLKDILAEHSLDDVNILNDGIDLAEHLNRLRPDVILLDVLLPHRGAFSVIENIKNDSTFRHIPIIVITGQQELRNSFNSEPNVRACFIKPVDITTLVHEISQITHSFDSCRKRLDENASAAFTTVTSLQTELKALKDLVKKGDERYYNVVGKSLSGAVVVNSEDNILYVNPEAENIFGKTATQLLQEKLRIPFNSSKRHDLQISNPKKGILDVESASTRISWDGRPAVLVSLRDVTVSKQAIEEREKLVDHLLQSNQELERFAYICSHDLQEPIRMMRSFSEKLQLHLDSENYNDTKIQKYLKFVNDGAVRAQQLISDILEYSSINSNTQEIDRVDVLQLVNNIKEEMIVFKENTDFRLTHDVLPDIQGNKTQIYQLLKNLVNNAIKYQKSDSVPHVHLSVIDAEEYWQFSVKDNGIGMEQRHLSKIFDVFQRLHGKSKYTGTGIGLSICKKVVEQHGGELWVESIYGVGSTFNFTLLKTIQVDIDNEMEPKAI